MSQSHLLEGVNANFLVFTLSASLIFAHYIWANWDEGYRYLRAALAIEAVFVGEVILRLNFWWARHQLNAGNGYDPSEFLTILGSATTSWGILCLILVFSPERWGGKAGYATLFASAAFLYWALTRNL
jgi:hypothetical protein